MASLNKKRQSVKVYTHEGGQASKISIEEQFKRTLFSCLLWEDTFYESGESIVDRLISYVKELPVETSMFYLQEAKKRFNLRHVPLLIIVALFITGKYKEAKTPISEVVYNTISRPDEITELLKIYWELNNNKKSLPAQMKKGIAKAFTKFDEYQLAKYKKTKHYVTLRDAMFLTHPKPLNKEMEKWFNELANNTLPTPYTWETVLSSGANKKEAWTELLLSGKLGSMALLRNLRNMIKVGVDHTLMINSLEKANFDKLFPYRFISVYTALINSQEMIPSLLLNTLEKAMYTSISKYEKLKGSTVLLIDISGSMGQVLSNGSSKRIDVASALGILINEICENSYIFGFNDNLISFFDKGFSLYNVINSFVGGGTYLEEAIQKINEKISNYDRFIIITDEQSHDGIGLSKANKNYIINVASYENGVGYEKKWVHINGFSSTVIDFIIEYEKEYKK